MDLRLCLKEGSDSLEDRFESFDSARREAGVPGLREVILLMRETPYPHTVYALSSMDRLCLLSQNYWDTPWWVLVTCDGDSDGYKIAGHVPANSKPGETASSEFVARNPAQAVEIIIKAMETSLGWDSQSYGIPGLAEIIAQSLSSSKDSVALDKMISMLCPETRPSSVQWSPAGHQSTCAMVAQTSTDKAIVYHSEGGYTYGRWGLAAVRGDIFVATHDDDWYGDLWEAFYASAAWRGAIPADLYSFRNVEEWRARPDLKRFPEEIPR